ncbi:MAG: EAL domain-containing protein [Clostridiales bacterium]|nr:EAL domain-containing protein [Clostridiales bacterium]
MNSKIKKIIYSGIVFILVFGMFALMANFEHTLAIERHKQDARDALLMTQTNLESMIKSRMISMGSIAAYVEIDNEISQLEYSSFAKNIYASSDEIVKSMTFITDTTITHIYPYEENKAAIGIDLASEASQRDLILYAKNNLKAVFTAPVNLVEGGIGIIVRIPVVVNDGYYGQVAIIFDFDKTIVASGIESLSSEYIVELAGFDSLSGEKAIIWKNDGNPVGDSIIQEVNLYDSTLTLTVLPREGWQGKTVLYYMLWFIGVIVSIFAFMGMHKVVSFNDDLKGANEELENTIGRLQISEAYITHMAEHDALTELYNRRKFVEFLGSQLSSGKTGSVLLLDIDNFKNINDTLGHVYGDKVLVSVSKGLLEAVEGNAHVFRFGGDEFIVLMMDVTDTDSIDRCIENIVCHLDRGNEVEHIKNHITASIGVSRYPSNGNTVEELLLKADIAMYSAKKSGKNKRQFFFDDLISNFENRINIENRLRGALESNEFMIYYQPIIDAKTGDISSFEALLRLKDLSMPPNEFIPIAEENGMIVPIGKWVIREVLDQLQKWEASGFEIKPVAINLSPRQIYDATISEFVEEELTSRGIEPSMIEIEITESVLIDNKEENMKVLAALKKIGVIISLDDFGTGYSSLNYLTYMPVDKIKLDKSLKDRFIDMEDTKMMDGLISIAHGLNLKVVVEGVEEAGEFEKLVVTNCDYMQGYCFGRPSPADQVHDSQGRFVYRSLSKWVKDSIEKDSKEQIQDLLISVYQSGESTLNEFNS